MTLHSEIALGQMHVPYNWTYADTAARSGATGFVAEDVGKFARQLDNNTLWMLTDDSPVTWEQMTGSGVGGAVSSVNSLTGVVVLDTDDISDSGHTNKFTTASDITKLAGIEALADVTDATNVDAAGAVMNSDTTVAGMSFKIDEDNMASNLDTKFPTQQSVKAYVDSQIGGVGSYTDEMARDALGAALTAGTGITVTPNDGADIITIATTITQYTDEMARDALGTALTAGTGITVTPNDGADTITIATTITQYTDELAQDAIGTLFIDSTNIDVTYSDGGNTESIDLTTVAKTFTINYIIDGGGVAITTGIKGDIIVDRACSIVRNTILLDQSGSIVIDIWKDTYANYPPVVGDSITASAKPTVSGATKSQDSTLTGWTTSVSAGDTLRFNVDSITTATRALISLKCVAA